MDIRQMARKEITAYTLERGDVRQGEEDRDYMKMSNSTSPDKEQRAVCGFVTLLKNSQFMLIVKGVKNWGWTLRMNRAWSGCRRVFQAVEIAGMK